MFLPLDRKPDWRNPPLVTLFIVLLNVLVFYIWQHNDDRHQMEAHEYYMYSGLYRTELQAYQDYRKDGKKLSEKQLDQPDARVMQLLADMYTDKDFQDKLAAGEIIKPGDPAYEEWQSQRKQFDWLEGRIVGMQYGLKPADPTLTTYFTNMFLHADNSHLWGNMIIFLLMGYVVEIVLGRWLYLLGYLFSGLTAGWLYVILYPDTVNYGLGASGAIAGVLGMYILIFGMRRINFFYFLFVYFDFIRAPAILMLPFYVLSQAIIEFLSDSNINVAAHIGGLAGGLLFAGILKFFPKTMNTEYLDEKRNEEQFNNDYAAAQRLLASMQIDEAREKFEALLKQRPGDINITQQLYTIAKYNPASETYHQYAAQLLNLPGADSTTVKIIHDTFTDYAAKAKPKPRWTPGLLISMATRFAACDYLDDAEKIVNFLLKAKADYAGNVEGLAALAKYYRGKDRQKAEQYRRLLLERFPHSSEAQHFARALNPGG